MGVLMVANFQVEKIKGVIPALVTCFDEEENFDEKRMRSVVNYLLTQNVDGLYLTGSTGEAFLMTPNERKQVVEVVVDEVKGKIPIIVHVGSIGTKVSIDLAKHAYEVGADAISSVPPFYWKFSNDDIYNYYYDITQASPLPMLVYNIPLAGAIGYDMIKRLASIEGVRGIKYTDSTHYVMLRIKEEIGTDFMVYSGMDEMAISGLAFGADGVIGSFYNLMPEVHHDIVMAVANNDIERAARKQSIANKIILLALEYDMISLMKCMMRWMGVDAGYSRRPFTNYRGEEEERIKDRFRSLKEHNDVSGIRFMEMI